MSPSFVVGRLNFTSGVSETDCCIAHYEMKSKARHGLIASDNSLKDFRTGKEDSKQ